MPEQKALRFGVIGIGIIATTDYQTMLARPDVDAVFIATLNSLHADQAIAVVREATRTPAPI